MKFKKKQVMTLLEKVNPILVIIYPVLILADIFLTYAGVFYFDLIETNELLLGLWVKYGYWTGSLLNSIPLLSFLFISYCFVEKVVKPSRQYTPFSILFFIALIYASLLSFIASINNLTLILTS